MRVGDIFYFASNKARNYHERDKYHLFVCNGDWYDDGDKVFLFINKSNAFGDGFEIKKAEGYDFLKLEYSFIGCSSTVPYSDDYLAEVTDKPVGRLRDDHVDALHAHIIESPVMEERDIRRICTALQKLSAQIAAKRKK